jgi:hypothetical protein
LIQPLNFIILQEVEQWCKMSKSSKLDRAVQNLKSELQKLEPPAKLVNMLNSGLTPTTAASATATVTSITDEMT